MSEGHTIILFLQKGFVLFGGHTYRGGRSNRGCTVYSGLSN